MSEQWSMIEAEFDLQDTKKDSDTEEQKPKNTKKVSDIEQHESFNWEGAAIAALEEIFLTISSAVVYLYGQWNSEVGRGRFSVVRQSDARSAPAMFVKVGRHLHWAITKKVFVSKVDKLSYFFSIVVAAPVNAVEDDMLLSSNDISEVLNYLVSFPKEEEESSSLQHLDCYLKQYARFNGSSSFFRNSRFNVKD